MSLVSGSLLVQNEREANSFIVKILWVNYVLAAAVLFAIYLVTSTHLTIANIVLMLLLLGLIFLGCTIVNRLFGEKGFVKYAIIFASLLGVSGFVYIIGNAAYVPIIIIIPLLLSTLYYDLRLSIAVGIFVPLINALIMTGMPIHSSYDEPVSSIFQFASSLILFVIVVALVFLTHWGARLFRMSLALEKNVAEQADDLEKVLIAAKNTGDRVSASSETLATSSEQMNASLVHATQEESSRAVENMEKGVVEVNTSSEAISSANDTLRSIMGKFEVIVKQIKQVASASEEIGAGSQELSSVVEEQTATMNSISEAAAELQNQVHELHNVLNRAETT